MSSFPVSVKLLGGRASLAKNSRSVTTPLSFESNAFSFTRINLPGVPGVEKSQSVPSIID